MRNPRANPRRARSDGPSSRPSWRGLLLGLAACLLPATADAFPHVVSADETLAKIAQRYYGRIQLERVLAVANGMDGGKGYRPTPGMIVQVPAITYHQATSGETWKSLALRFLGSKQRHIVLAQLNGAKPWIEPELGQVVRIPYNLPWLATGEESLATLAYRFLGSTKHAYRLVQYNDLGEDGPRKGQVLLIPLSDLPLTSEGRQAALAAAERLSEESQGARYERQQSSELALRKLRDDVRGGRYVSAVQSGTRLLSVGELPRPQEADVQRQLLEAFVALGVPAKAREACQAHINLAETPDLDPLMTSPKVLQACANLSRVPERNEDPTTPPEPEDDSAEPRDEDP